MSHKKGYFETHVLIIITVQQALKETCLSQHSLFLCLSLSLSFSLSSFSRSPGLAVLQRILDTAAERGWQVTSVNLDVVTEVAFVKLLSDLDYKREFQIIIDCELERLNYILNLVKKYNQSISFLPLLAP